MPLEQIIVTDNNTSLEAKKKNDLGGPGENPPEAYRSYKARSIQQSYVYLPNFCKKQFL